MSVIQELPGHLIRRLHQISVSAFTQEVGAAGFDLTPVQFAALRMLKENPDIDQATLAGLIAYDRVTLGGVVNRLEARGLIERTISETDRRARQLRLTERGESVLTTVWPAVRRTQETILKDLTPEEQETLLRLLRKMADANNELSRAPLRPTPPKAPAR
ncbi:MAG: winged helix-turn-helix transcriptional regulator [Thioclava marina]|jgi:transcriptional regulator, MarR family|uniref:MarR family winged helix-turn-helix transcriptional regulator n=1 Tax=Thioclava marina TaxID=1915077 RepID=UPI00198C2249|nr:MULTISPECIES: MarR family winged helix-turn-helix transcriptional regulator [Thioclava]MBC7144040.1 winged helix-turn-helix transcriptional regulator [Thioclava marina]MBD3804650.1 winged helix-turn-helix transcriptional regulator [Thioclava sp.]TNF14298.1 MAG: MarR family transcriptional regulator [Paracoccaceae bacterium]